MKRRALHALAGSRCHYLCSRNHDIAGYWGIGVLCAAAKRKWARTYSFKISPGRPVFIDGSEVTDSSRVTNKLLKLQIDTIDGRIAFVVNGHYPDGTDKYTCSVVVAISQCGQTVSATRSVECWAHDPARESRRAGTWATRLTLFERLKRLLS